MKSNKIAVTAIASILVCATHAYKGMSGVTADLLSTLSSDSDGVIEMIGDLQSGANTAIGVAVRNCLNGDGPCQSVVYRVHISRSR
jgi:hypothetical protein